ncbi:phage major tail tube protein [Dechloromonas denitrificans]|uniref:phage major tail tube protein n=1 Tax=Dechloromonas denitrificans TaxID=281362 RepID=UPI001CF8871B|nr:phage major tail tube protein [Dechloromonas denitrificans]UCV02310.1 phage major tail tube protein [Dechloromonas denitrificans]
MALPSNLKNFNLFNDGNSLMGVAEEVALPKLSRKMEEFQGAGMPMPIDVDISNEKIELDWTCSGFVFDVVKQYGAAKANANLLRFAGAYQREDTGDVDAVEIVVRGRHKELDFGNAKVGDKTQTKIKTTCSYYKLTVNGSVLFEIDALAMVFIVDGVDMLDKQRKAIGLA